MNLIPNEELYAAGGMYRKGPHIVFHLVHPGHDLHPYVVQAHSREALRRLTMHHSHLYRLNFIGDDRIEATLIQKSYDCEQQVAAPIVVELDEDLRSVVWDVIKKNSYTDLRPA
jgi:hypothetical protein